jgi:hypothetical protein
MANHIEITWIATGTCTKESLRSTDQLYGDYFSDTGCSTCEDIEMLLALLDLLHINNSMQHFQRSEQSCWRWR